MESYIVWIIYGTSRRRKECADWADVEAHLKAIESRSYRKWNKYTSTVQWRDNITCRLLAEVEVCVK